MKAFLGRWWWRIALALVVVLAAIQLVPYSVEDRSARDEPTWDSPRTRTLFMRACGDCHSNETKVLWFEHVAPVKWYVANHVEEGRHALNVSEWHTAAGRELDEATEPIEKGEMPPSSYTMFGLHSDAKLSAAEKEQLIAGLRATIAADPPTSSGRGGD